jgi:hypothetical protein
MGIPKSHVLAAGKQIGIPTLAIRWAKHVSETHTHTHTQVVCDATHTHTPALCPWQGLCQGIAAEVQQQQQQQLQCNTCPYPIAYPPQPLDCDTQNGGAHVPDVLCWWDVQDEDEGCALHGFKGSRGGGRGSTKAVTAADCGAASSRGSGGGGSEIRVDGSGGSTQSAQHSSGSHTQQSTATAPPGATHTQPCPPPRHIPLRGLLATSTVCTSCGSCSGLTTHTPFLSLPLWS